MATLPSRYLTAQIQRDLAKKMVFLAGARQVGKTTLARSLPFGTRGYMSWDAIEDRDRLLRRELPQSPLWILDEIHKYRQWRGLVKGLFDKREPGQRILVTGSAKLDFYRYGGDSLQGRYHLLRLHPLSVAELGIRTSADFRQLLALGGFPEPFFGGSAVEARRWSREYRSRLVREDIASLERVQDLGQLELLAQRLPALVGSPLSVNALREDLQVSHPTVEAWLGVLERTYAIFRLSALGLPRVRTVKKQRKHYHLDWSVVPEPAARFENLVAGHLLKWVQFEEDSQGRDLELRYFRDRDGREVDFVVTEDGKPILLVEAKLSDAEVDGSLRYLLARCPGAVAWQVSATGKKSYRTPEGVRVAPVMELLQTLI
jgi:predicted AAA+ superfamily ATPase